MNMEVVDCLPGGGSVVDPNVEAGGVGVVLDFGFGLGYKIENCGSFSRRQIKKGNDMPLGNNECMAGGNGEAIGDGESKFVLEDLVVFWNRAKGACVCHKIHSPSHC